VQLNIQFSRGSASTHFRWGGSRSYAIFFYSSSRNTKVEKYWNWCTFARVVRHNVRAPFFETQCRNVLVDASYYLQKNVLCLSVCLYVANGRPIGWADQDQTWHRDWVTHVDPRSVLVKVKVKVIYLCLRYNRIHDSGTWRTTMKHARSSSSSSAVAGATWWMLIKLLA